LRTIKNARTIDEVLLDPYSGRADIKSRLIRAVSQFSLPEDPLRILRAFSLGAIFNLKIEPKTKIAIKKYKKKITSSAFERISEELFKILNSGNGFKAFQAMDEYGILDELMPEIKLMRGVWQGPYHHLDVFGHAFEALRQIELLFSELRRNKDIQGYLNKVISGTHTKRALLKLGAFLHDIGKPASKERIKGKTCFHGHERIGRNITRDIGDRLRLSNDEKNALDRMIFWHLRPGYIADIENLSQRAVYRFFRDAQGEAASILLLSIADQRSTRGPLTRGANRKHHEDVCLGLAREFFRKAKEKKLLPLVNGYDIMRHLKLPPGPLIGKILEEIKEAQAAGELKTKPQALELSRRFLKGA
jgi:putative nucleotidyltransferase with HDIG domain